MLVLSRSVRLLTSGTAANMTQHPENVALAKRSLQLDIRQSERTTAEEVRLTQLELEQQLGGLFSLLTVEFLGPLLNRTCWSCNVTGSCLSIPKEFVRPSIVAGVNALGRGQDRESP